MSAFYLQLNTSSTNMSDTNIVDDQHVDGPAEEGMSGHCDAMFPETISPGSISVIIDPDGDLLLKVGTTKCLLNEERNGLNSKKRARSGGYPSKRQKKTSQNEDTQNEDALENEHSHESEGHDTPPAEDEAASYIEDEASHIDDDASHVDGDDLYIKDEELDIEDDVSGVEDDAVSEIEEVEFMQVDYENYASGEDEDFHSDDGSADDPPDDDDSITSADDDIDCQPDENGLKHRHTGTITYMVDSRALARASPVWKELLYGENAKSKPANASTASDWVVELPEDNPFAMEALLDIVHGNFGLTPPPGIAIDEGELFELTVLTNKYSLTRSIQPWARTWMDFVSETFEDQSEEPHSDYQFYQLLWIAWELGAPNLFSEVAWLLTRHCAIDDNGDLQLHLYDRTIELFTELHEPPGMQENIRAVREDLIKQLLAPYVALVDSLMDVSSDKHYCESEDDIYNGHHTCHSLILGRVIRSLSHIKLWPIPKPDKIKMSPDELIQILDKVETQNGSKHHEDCIGIDRYMLSQSQAVLDKKYQPLADHISHMKTQAKKSGLSHGTH
ncbi:hypothetical protein F5Y18DRAFT_176821 [Xylariaceae sp. FL1019]|nr:hypothetical protein F5Y18DRAFT_176821 [Xylariaceae sp. FL1019]